ncbi:hypothetical protein B0T24DRAFT_644414 [Lasiosphaeria ovina]|uniref:Uncharacterized protein n=1 Tax=Lasiosphaeria ovina TaxID=92902 RepID=A0AAE0JRN5_9PEZI|nr:hypothetical protein B0T24DRAFT_644414 [Lasiosphaeria ovina]
MSRPSMLIVMTALTSETPSFCMRCALQALHGPGCWASFLGGTTSSALCRMSLHNLTCLLHYFSCSLIEQLLGFEGSTTLHDDRLSRDFVKFLNQVGEGKHVCRIEMPRYNRPLQS